MGRGGGNAAEHNGNQPVKRRRLFHNSTHVRKVSFIIPSRRDLVIINERVYTRVLLPTDVKLGNLRHRVLLCLCLFKYKNREIGCGAADCFFLIFAGSWLCCSPSERSRHLGGQRRWHDSVEPRGKSCVLSDAVHMHHHS